MALRVVCEGEGADALTWRETTGVWEKGRHKDRLLSSCEGVRSLCEGAVRPHPSAPLSIMLTAGSSPRIVDVAPHGQYIPIIPFAFHGLTCALSAILRCVSLSRVSRGPTILRACSFLRLGDYSSNLTAGLPFRYCIRPPCECDGCSYGEIGFTRRRMEGIRGGEVRVGQEVEPGALLFLFFAHGDVS